MQPPEGRKLTFTGKVYIVPLAFETLLSIHNGKNEGRLAGHQRASNMVPGTEVPVPE